MAKKKATAKAVEEVKENVELETPEVIEDPRKEEVEEEVKKEEKPVEKKSDVIGQLKGGKEVHQAGKHLKVKAVIAPIHKRELPEDIQRWLTNKGYGTNVYLESKEWLEKHNVDKEKVEQLKKFINDRYL